MHACRTSIYIYYLRSRGLALQRCSYSAVIKYGGSSMSTVRFWFQFSTSGFFPGSLLLLFCILFSLKKKRGVPGVLWHRSGAYDKDLYSLQRSRSFGAWQCRNWHTPTSNCRSEAYHPTNFLKTATIIGQFPHPHILSHIKILDHDGHFLWTLSWWLQWNIN